METVSGARAAAAPGSSRAEGPGRARGWPRARGLPASGDCATWLCRRALSVLSIYFLNVFSFLNNKLTSAYCNYFTL